MIFGYIRVSTEEQKKSDRSGISRQIEFIKTAAKSRGCDNPTIIDDSGVSGFGQKNKNNLKSGALGKFLEEVSKGIYDNSTFIVENLDRLARDFSGGMQAIITLKKHGIEVITKDGGFETLADKLLATISLARSEEESRAKSDKIKSSYSKKIKAAISGEQVQFNQVPRFYSWNGEKYIIDPEYHATVIKAVQMYLNGRGYGVIAHKLNEGNYKGSRDNLFWHGSHVQQLITHKSLNGDFYINDETIEGFFPPLLDEVTYAKLKVALSQRKRVGRGGKPFSNTLITALGGITKCGSCGGALVKTRTRYDKYSIRCKACLTKSDGRTSFASAQLEPIEQAVYDYSVNPFEFEAETSTNETRIKYLELELKRLSDAITRAFEMAEDDEFLLSVAKKRAQISSEKRKTVEAELEQLKLEESALNLENRSWLKMQWAHICSEKKVCDLTQEEIDKCRTLITKTYKKINIFFNTNTPEKCILVELYDRNYDYRIDLLIVRKTGNIKSVRHSAKLEEKEISRNEVPSHIDEKGNIITKAIKTSRLVGMNFLGEDGKFYQTYLDKD